MTEILQQSPLHDFHKEQGGRLVPFAGWEMPVQYSGILEEHRATRESAGLFDVSHMGEMRIFGKQAQEFLNYLITNDLSGIGDGQAIYSPACYDQGGVVDDLIIYRHTLDHFFVCCNASNTKKVDEWFNKQSIRFECQVENVSSEYAQLAVQGPKAVALLETFVPNCGSKINRFHFIECDILGQSCLLSRTGYTGEDGFEIYLPPTSATGFAREILERGHSEGLRPVGLGARDSLRLEAGLPLYGHEISEMTSPIEGSLGWTVKLNKSCNFIGKEALQNQKKEENPRRVIHFNSSEKRIARQGCTILADEKPIGEVLSGSFSPMTNRAIGSALVYINEAKNRQLRAEIRGKAVQIHKAKPPLHKTDK
ncbi:MAG: glycine cleavage system aminomethyltransferase GcvT [Opitutae bacterium]|nr:glycine cleavage system aminomethyltransferase GcvT [Opitutae bacterium]MBT5378601.1 glycine cleavage system aminomethyltransferase GcvT [Opitutae bacterium]MBT5692646.1 glycine cleavage system aminomethyltransferase GcvT [Opitutae bacterium]MBT6461764.1 glycine cleavage system aminomethyltransferase GcvT [Opitutae bacterium]MBT6958083.1 glycine cleavage system aminomethyltransferase GcvT [Opitutae bacterium]